MKYYVFVVAFLRCISHSLALSVVVVVVVVVAVLLSFDQFLNEHLKNVISYENAIKKREYRKDIHFTHIYI